MLPPPRRVACGSMARRQHRARRAAGRPARLSAPRSRRRRRRRRQRLRRTSAPRMRIARQAPRGSWRSRSAEAQLHPWTGALHTVAVGGVMRQDAKSVAEAKCTSIAMMEALVETVSPFAKPIRLAPATTPLQIAQVASAGVVMCATTALPCRPIARARRLAQTTLAQGEPQPARRPAWRLCWILTTISVARTALMESCRGVGANHIAPTVTDPSTSPCAKRLR
mmetsp:Transcript_43873/g.93341  ORF Transcript_43873/g.93341 Transcript_43873/m.93341 type:complete len:224 (-) Transcript_43873:681-1352(-)